MCSQVLLIDNFSFDLVDLCFCGFKIFKTMMTNRKRTFSSSYTGY